MLIASFRMHGRAEKDFRKSKVSNTFTVANRSVYLHDGTMWKKVYL
jgi:hypothetical protein